MIKLLKDFLFDSWDNVASGITPPKKRLRFLLAKGSLGADSGKANVFVFIDGSPQPALIVKTVRDPNKAHLLQREFDILNFLRANLSLPLKSRLPQAYFFGNLGEYPLLVEEAVTGNSIETIVTSRLAAKLQAAKGMLIKAADWLSLSQAEISARSFSASSEASNRYPQQVQERFLQIYPPQQKEAAFFDELIGQSVKHNFRFFFGHGDYSPINIIFSQDAFWIIDWAASSKSSPACSDIFFLLTWLSLDNYAYSKGAAYRMKQFSETFFQQGCYAGLARSALQRYCQCLNINIESLWIYFTLFLMEQSAQEYARLNTQAQLGHIPILNPLGKAKSYSDGSLLKNGIYINLLRVFIWRRKEFIFKGNGG